MWIDWLDLPKLNTLRTSTEAGLIGYGSATFAFPDHITLESDSHPLWLMLRHAQSCRCVSSRSIQLQEWYHNQRKYSPHSSLTNRHWSSSTILQLIIETCMISSSFCYIHYSLVHQKITETYEVVSDSNEWRVIVVLPFHSELIIELETIHIFNTLSDRVEKNRISFG